MRSSIFVPILSCLALASAQKLCPLPPKDASAKAASPAPMITVNPPMAMYSAELPKDAKAQGTISLASADMGVKIDLKLTLPAEGGPFMYHIHAKPVPSVRCISLAHLRSIAG